MRWFSWPLAALASALLLLPTAARADLKSPGLPQLPGQPPSAHAQTHAVVSQSGLTWTDAQGHSGRTAYSVGHNGCRFLDTAGYCAQGAWPRVGNGHWIWAADLTVPEVFISQEVEVAADAQDATLVIHITADDLFKLYVNGQYVGANNDWPTIKTYQVAVHPGSNLIVVKATNLGRYGEYNPGGVAWDAAVTYSVRDAH